MTKKFGAELGRENLVRLERYLAGVEDIPMRGSKVNISAIANACGFDRQVLYKNPACRDLLNAAMSAQNFDGIEKRGVVEAGNTVDMVLANKLSEAEKRADALEKRLSEYRARIFGLEVKLRRYETIDEELTAKGRRAFPRPLHRAEDQ